MPDAREHMQNGLAYEKAGAPGRALDAYRAALAAARDPATAAEALRRQSHALRAMCEWDRALDAARRAVRMAQEPGLEQEQAEALNAEAAVHQSRGDFTQAVPLYERMLALTRDDRIRGVALQNLAGIAAQQGELDVAESRFTEALEHFERAGYAWGQAHVLNNTTALALDRGADTLAEDRGRQAVEAARMVNDLELVAVARVNYAEALYRLDRLSAAETQLTSALGQFTASGNRWRRIEVFRLLGLISERGGDHALARRLYERAIQDAEVLGVRADVESLRARLPDSG